MTMARTASVVAILLLSCLAVHRAEAGQDELARAKELYMSAAYDEALAALSDYHPPDAIEADEYRAFCLLALGKTEDATKVIEQIVATQPSFRPQQDQASPRVQDAFRTVRRRMLPSIVKQTYLGAKDAFDRSAFEVAAREFARVITLLDDPELADSGGLADLRVLSKGFGELIQKTATAAATQVPARGARDQPPTSPETQSPDAWKTDHLYGAGDPEVTPPVVISQNVPPWRSDPPQSGTYEAAIVVLIDEIGDVTSVRLQGPLRPPYDALLRQAASRWKYRPAMKDGRPVRYQKVVAIRLTPAGPSR